MRGNEILMADIFPAGDHTGKLVQELLVELLVNIRLICHIKYMLRWAFYFHLFNSIRKVAPYDPEIAFITVIIYLKAVAG